MRAPAAAASIALCVLQACALTSASRGDSTGDQEVSCLDVPVPLDPLLFGAGLKERDAIARAAEEGLVVVRYIADGCNVKLRVLSDCHAAGQYAYKAQKARVQKVVKTERTLLELLPVAGRPAYTAFQKYGALRFDEEIVGRLEGGPASAKLAGNRCDGATHVAVAIDLGGSALSSGAARTLDDKQTLFDERTRDLSGVKIVEQMGDARSCVKALRRGEKTPGCDVPLRLLLEPIGAAAKVVKPIEKSAKIDKEEKVEKAEKAEKTEKPEKKPAVVERREKVDVSEPVSIPAGEYWMGAKANERGQAPRKKVALEAYAIDRADVTAADYAECVHQGACSPAKTGGQCTTGDPKKADHPMNCVTFVQAKAYCAYKKKRLPTEAEWERAARGTDDRSFVWGNDWPPPDGAGNFADEAARKIHPYWMVIRDYDDGWPETSPAGALSKGRSPTGALDMAGNVYQWTMDQWPDHSARIVRGSSFGHHNKGQLLVTARAAYREDQASEHIGFRCVLPLK